MLNSKTLLLVSLLTFSGITLANANEPQSLADPNTKLSENSTATKAEAIQIDADKKEKSLELKTVKSDQNSADKIVENKSSAEVIKSENAQAAAAVHPDLQVLEFVLSDNVVHREPQNIVENFNKDSKQGFAFARLSAVKQSDVTFIWLRDGKEQTRFTTSVHASKKWRTFSSAKLKSGEWTVRLVSGDTVIAEKTFTIQ